MCYKTLAEPKKIKINDAVMEKSKVCLHFGGKAGCVEDSVLVNMDPN